VHDDGDYLRRGDGKYEQTVNRHFEAWQYQELLAKVCLSVLLLALLWVSSNTNYMIDRVWLTNNLQLR